MNNHKALIIAFEGLDCSFKETNSKSLQNFLKEKYPNKNVYLYSFPNYSSQSSYFLKSWLSRKYEDQFKDMEKSDIAQFISSLYTLDRFDTFATEDIYSKLDDENNIIIFDRYSLSNIYYQTAGMNDGKYISTINSIYNFEHRALNLPIEDITIIMRTPFNMIINKLSEKKNKDNNELDLHFLRQVYDNLDHLILLIKKNTSYLDMNLYRNNDTVKEVWVNEDDNKTFKSEDDVFHLVVSSVQPLIDKYYFE